MACDLLRVFKSRFCARRRASPRRIRAGSTISFGLALLCACGVAAGSSFSQRPALIFDIDQGFPFGITENRDLASLARILAVVEKFRRRFDVYLVFTPLTAKQDNLLAVLRLTAAHRVPFLLDVYSSDAMTVGNVLIPVNSEADPSHATALSLDGLRRLKMDTEIGRYFAGLRFFEVMAADFTVKTCLDRAK